MLGLKLVDFGLFSHMIDSQHSNQVVTPSERAFAVLQPYELRVGGTSKHLAREVEACKSFVLIFRLEVSNKN